MSISKKKRDMVKAEFNGKCAYSGTDLTPIDAKHLLTAAVLLR